MAKQNKITGLVLIALGLYVTIYSFVQLEIGTMSKPGCGFFTFVCGIGILVMTIIWVLSGRKIKVSTNDGPLWQKRQWIRPLLGVCMVIVYALLMVPLGYIISTAIFIVLWQVIVEHNKPITIILFAIIGTGTMYLLFEVLLAVPLPNGILNF